MSEPKSLPAAVDLVADVTYIAHQPPRFCNRGCSDHPVSSGDFCAGHANFAKWLLGRVSADRKAVAGPLVEALLAWRKVPFAVANHDTAKSHRTASGAAAAGNDCPCCEGEAKREEALRWAMREGLL